MITFTTYGTWLHGDDRGSADDEHNFPHTPYLPPNAPRRQWEQTQMKHPPFSMTDAWTRSIVLNAILAVCRHRYWRSWIHVRTNHVHAVVIGLASPEKIMNDFKAYASRALNRSTGSDQPEPKASAPGHSGAARRSTYWTEHGSTRWLWTQAQLEDKIDYVKNRQGIPMAYGET